MLVDYLAMIFEDYTNRKETFAVKGFGSGFPCAWQSSIKSSSTSSPLLRASAYLHECVHRGQTQVG